MAINTNRVEWIDMLKGILILLVVLGHVVGSAANMTIGSDHQIYRFIFKVIYLFHMPAFFFMAGLTYRTFDPVDKARRLLIPYSVFGVLSIAVYQIMVANEIWWHPWASLLYGAPFIGTDGFRCNSVLWFLPCLFSTIWIFTIISKLESKLHLDIIFKPTIILLCIVGFVMLRRYHCPSLPYGIIQCIKYLPFFIVGNMLSPALFKSKSCINAVATRCLNVSFIMYIVVVFFAPFDWGVYYSYWKWAITVIIGFLGVLGCCFASMKLNSSFVSQIGQSSIGIMMTHKWFVLFLNRIGISNALFVFLCSAGGSFVLTLMIRRFSPWVLGEFKK